MNCVDWEGLVALHAGGDLSGAEGAAVEQHLGECPGCQMLWSGVRENLAVLQAAHAAVPVAAHFTAVRSRVLAELERGAHPWRKLAWISGVAGLAAVLVLAAIWQRGTVPVAPRILAAIPAAPLGEAGGEGPKLVSNRSLTVAARIGASRSEGTGNASERLARDGSVTVAGGTGASRAEGTGSASERLARNGSVKVAGGIGASRAEGTGKAGSASLTVAGGRAPLTVKLQTADPNIVIYWIAD